MQAPHRDGQYFNLGTPTELWPLWTFWRFDHLLQLISLSAFAMLRRPLLVCWCQLYASARQEPGPRPCWRCLQSPRCHRNVIAMQSQCCEACCHVLAVQCHGRSCFHAAFHALDLLRCRSDHCRINANLFEGREIERGRQIEKCIRLSWDRSRRWFLLMTWWKKEENRLLRFPYPTIPSTSRRFFFAAKRPVTS